MKPTRIRATILFSDLVGYTALAEERGPEEAFLVLTGCIAVLDSVARARGGSVDKYFGDALMAVFGYPVPQDQPAWAAVDAALEMRERVREYNAELGLATGLEIHIGINTGNVVSGDLTGPVIREFHVLGDAVNVAARLKERAPLGGIFIGPNTYAETAIQFRFRDQEQLKLKGKQASVNTYEVLGPASTTELEGIIRRARILTHMIGRADALEKLRGAVARLEQGRGGIVRVSGDTGSGKSRLLAEICASPELKRFRTLDLHLGVAKPEEFALLRELARALSSNGDALERNIESLVQPAKQRFFRRGGRRVASRTGLRRAFTALVSRRAHQEPLIIVIDDLDHADPSSLDVLKSVFSVAVESPVLFLLTTRDAKIESTRESEKSPNEHGVEIELGPLSTEDAERLIDALDSDGTLSAEIRATIIERGQGNASRLTMGVFLAPALRSEQTRLEQQAERSSDAERRRATILFADLSGFTSLTEAARLEDAYEIVTGALHVLDETAKRHGGTVDKYLGDCVMVLFGVPHAIEDAPRAAVNSAIEMRRRIAEYSAERGVALEVHSGIHTGLGIAGEISGPVTLEYAVMGEPVAVASKLKDIAHSGEIYVGEETHRFTRNRFEYRAVDPIEVRGASEPVRTYALLSDEEELFRDRVDSDRLLHANLVGRDREFGILSTAIEHLKNGQGSFVSLVGEAGLGKSRLLKEIQEHGETQSVKWLEGRSLSNGQTISFHPFADLLRSWVGIDDEDDDRQARRKLDQSLRLALSADAESAAPFVASLIGVQLSLPEQERIARIPGDAKEKLLRGSLTRLFRSVSQAQPLILVFDDLHWADQSSVELLDSLLRLINESPVLILGVYRPGFKDTSDRIRNTVATQFGDRLIEIELEQLDRESARAMIHDLFRGGDVPHETRNRIEDKAQGNPLYIEEVIRALLETGAIEVVNGCLQANDNIHQVEIPGTVQEVLMARIDRLDLERKKLLQLAAVVGRSFHFDVLAQIIDDKEQLEQDLASLVRSQFLVEWDRLQGIEYAFRHPLIHEVTYEGILELRRREIHLHVAEAIEHRLTANLPGYYGMLAFHFSKAGDAERAETYLFRAGDEAARVAASNEALHFFREASQLYFEMYGDRADSGKRAELERKIGEALYNRGQLIEAAEHFDLALDALGEWVPRNIVLIALRFGLNISGVLMRLYLSSQLGGGRKAGNQDREIISLNFERAEAQTTTSPTRFLFDSMATLAKLQTVDPSSVPGAGGMYAGAVGIFAYGGASFGISRRFLNLAAQLVDPENHHEFVRFRFMNFLHHVLEGDWSEDHEIPDALLDKNLQSGAIWTVTNYLGLVAEKYIRQGNYETVLEHLERIEQIWDFYQHDLAKTNKYYLPMLLQFEQEQFEATIRAAQQYYDECPEDLLHVLSLSTQAAAQTELGRLDDAEASLERCEKTIRRCRPVPPFHLSSYQRARFQLDLAHLETATESSEQSRWARRTRASGRAALRGASFVAWRRPPVYRLMARYYAVMRKEARAKNWWDKALQACEQLGTDPERDRIERDQTRTLA